VKFHLSEQQEQIQDSVRRTLESVCGPKRRREILDSNSDFDSATWKGLMEVGLGGLVLPEEFGGSGLDLVDAALAMERLGAHAAPGPFMGHILSGIAIAQSGDEELKKKWLPKLASGELVGAVAFGEGWRPELWDGKLAPATGVEKADIIVAGVGGPSLVLVERSAAGVTINPIVSSDLTRRVASIGIDNASAPKIGGSKQAQRLFDAALVLLAADALGGAQTMLDMSVDYAKTREQFGVVIGQFQALKHQLANMALEVEPSRALVWYAAYAWDRELDDASRSAALSKAHLTDRFVSVARAAVQAHGGIGYTWEYDLQLWFKRSLFDRAYLGAPSLHRERAAELAGW
jgi:alkylation response protein AidB-like acyl-CoA dehydrogenase